VSLELQRTPSPQAPKLLLWNVLALVAAEAVEDLQQARIMLVVAAEEVVVVFSGRQFRQALLVVLALP
jgi:hypothetical protein